MIRIERCLAGLLSTCCYIVYDTDRDDCLVIDPGAEGTRIRAALQGKRLAGILLTHGHFDHIGGVEELADADTPLLIHRADAAMLSDPAQNVSWMIDERITCRPATRLLEEGDQIALAGLTLTVLHTPGHTAGSVCYRMGDVLFTGDTVIGAGYGRTDLPTGSEREMRQSLRRLLPMRENCTMYGGHA